MQHVSPNHGPRPDGARIELLVLHYTGMQSEAAALGWLCNPQSQVSSHYFVCEDGTVYRLVEEDRRAWHAGISSWRGLCDVNSRSIGVEIANPGHEYGYRPFPGRQIDAVIELCRGILSRHAIPARNVVAHSDVAPARKEDPGELFPWGQLSLAGIGHWVEPSPVRGGRYFQRGESGQPIEALQSMLALYGYDLPISGTFCETTEAVLRAFQRHFRPERVDGVADVSTIGTLHRLLKNLPSLD